MSPKDGVFPDRDGLASLHSEPDIDTIMPLPGAAPPLPGPSQLQNVVSPPVDEGGSDSGSSEEGVGEGYRGMRHHRPLLRQSSDFTTVEVCMDIIVISLGNMCSLVPFRT